MAILSTLTIAVLCTSCKEDVLFEQLPPDTEIFVEEINLTGLDRLNSIVKLHWTGEDEDGFVVGYELSLDEVSWTFTSRQDSTFRFDIAPGQDSADITFFVRAIDNDSLFDPSPAFLSVPIINTPPTVQLDSTHLIPDSVYSVFSTSWIADDLDGITTLDTIFIKLNEGDWYALPSLTNFITVVPEDPTSAIPQSGRLFTGLEASEQAIPLSGLRVGDQNRFFVKARDITGAESVIDSSRSFFLRVQSGDLLLIDVHRDRDADEFYFNTLTDIYPNFDYRNLLTDAPTFWDPTFRQFLFLYDKVVWYSEGREQADQGQRLLLDVAAPQIQSYLNGGGKLFTSVRFPTSFLDPAAALSLIFDFSPIDSFSTVAGQGRFGRGASVRPVSNSFPNLPVLVADSNSLISGVDPFFPKNPADALYETDIDATGGVEWVGPNVIAAKGNFQEGLTNQVFFSVELHKLNEDESAMQAFLSFVLLEAFSW